MRPTVIRFASPRPLLKLSLRHQARIGTPPGPPVLILHGATFPSANAAAWKIDGRSWMDELASAGYDVYALDFLGYGDSDRYPEMSLEPAAGTPLGDIGSLVTQVEFAAAVICAAHGGDRIHLVAHSAGTFVAARFAELHPEKLDRLVLFGPLVPGGEAAHPPPITDRYLHLGRADQLEAFERKVRDSGHLDMPMFEAWASAYLATDSHNDARPPASVRVPSGMIAAANEADRTGQLPYDPARIRVPTLVIQGEWDGASPASRSLQLFDRLGSPLKRFVLISQAGHRAHLEANRRQLYRETEAFLNGGDGNLSAATPGREARRA